jgi:hypothetical protein
MPLPAVVCLLSGSSESIIKGKRSSDEFVVAPVVGKEEAWCCAENSDVLLKWM